MTRRPNSLRLAGYDNRRSRRNRQPAAYFVTICAEGRACRLGRGREETVRPSAAGRLVEAAWRALPEHYPHVQLDAFVAMPNHVHGIVMIVDEDILEPTGSLTPGVAAQHAAPLRDRGGPHNVAPGSLGAIVRSFKSAATRDINCLYITPGRQFWQRGYWDRVLRNGREFEAARRYIADNPLRWHLDRLRPDGR
jgi:putative transposase